MNKRKTGRNVLPDRRGKFLAGGVIFFALGFLVLSGADNTALNGAFFISALLFLGGWTMIAAGLWKNE